MSSASKRQNDLMELWFGDPIGEGGPIKLLESHGFVLDRSFVWIKPTPSHNISEIEMECILFLIEEWDFGGVLDKKL